MKIPFLTLIVAIFISGTGFAQSGKFSEDPATFVKEVSKELNNLKRDDTKETASLLESNFSAGKISEEQMQTVIVTTNLLMSNSYRMYPHIENYLRAVNFAANAAISNAKFKNWNNTATQLVTTARKGDVRDFQKFMDFSILFLKDNHLYQSNTKSWIAETKNFDFKVIDGKPAVEMADVTLKGYTSGDKNTITHKFGLYFPLEERMNGKEGKLTWENAGLDPNNVYATFQNFSIDLTKSDYTIDTAKLHYGSLLKDPVAGRITNKLLMTRSESAKYPQFQTFQKQIELPNIVENVKFKGGFELNGSNINGYGDANEKAELTFTSPQGKMLAKSKSKSFNINKTERISSSSAEMIIYFDNDSIYHPNLNMKFRIPEKELSGNTGEGATSKSGFYDSYHNLEMKVERFTWNINKPEVVFSVITGGEQNPAYFESTNLFEKRKYDSYQAYTSYNPINVIKNYADGVGSDVLNAVNLAGAFGGLSIDQIRRTLYQLVEDGFIFYDQETETVIVKEKTFNYVLANSKMIDYDVIKVESRSDKINAVLNLNTKDLFIDGVKQVDLSNVQWVSIFPKEKKLGLRENRDMKFDGTVFGGRLDFHGKDYHFNYDKFQIELNKLDSMKINIPGTKKDATGNAELLAINTSFENLTGTLFIDKPTNKSGKEKNFQYPIFENRSPSYAYYDNNSVFKQVYKRDKFFFEIDPFTIDSLNTFTINTQKFTGELNSADIFPKMRKDLIIMEDLSMGLITQTPAEGYKIYGGKGKYYNKIDLSNRGLRGDGKFEFLGTTAVSKEVFFFPDSLKALSESFNSKKTVINNIAYPAIAGTNVNVYWEPYNDLMDVKMTDKPFEVFDKYATLAGEVKFTKTGAFGSGNMDWKDATLSSDNFKFGQFSLKADTANLKIKALDPTKVAFNLPNVSANINFDDQKGLFRSNEEGIPTELPYNQYQTTMNEFDWDMAKRIIDFRPPKDKEYSIFASTRPEQKGIAFNAKGGSYDMNNYVLVAHGVPQIYIADAAIVPGDGKIIIEAEAKMQQLKNAKIHADSANRLFTIYDAEVDIINKKDYKAKGKYDYINRSGKPQTISFEQISVKKLGGDTVYTSGVAAILDNENFLLDPKITFKGEAELDARNKFMKFTGVSKLLLKDTSKVKTDWVKISNEIDPKNITYSINDAKSDLNEPIFSGIHLRSDSTNLYATIAGTKHYPSDESIFNATGAIQYDQVNSNFTITTQDKLDGKSTLGNLIRYNDDKGNIYAEGKTNLAMNFNMIPFMSAGTMKKESTDTTFYFDMVAGLNILLTKEVMDMMSTDLTTLTYDSPELDYLEEEFQNKMVRFIGDEKQGEKFLNQMNKTGEFLFPENMNYNLVLTDLKMIWDPESGTFRSNAPIIGVATVGGKRVAKKLKGYVEFGKRRQGDFFNIYIETALKDWYFITYQEDLVQVLSSNVQFNDLVMDIKPDNRRFKGKNDQYITFAISNPAKKASFIERMRYYLNEQNN